LRLVAPRGLIIMPQMLLREATEKDAAGIRDLLAGDGLPASDLEASRPVFIVACENGKIIGTGGLQIFGPVALLRSVAVAPQWRRQGLGQTIVQELERIARAAHVTQLVLLTHTARSFFEQRGYRVIERGMIAAAVQGTEEFRSLCPASATCMRKIFA